MKTLLTILYLLNSTYKEPTPERVLFACEVFKIQEPLIVTSQAILESGWFKCDNCSLQYNNIFGFLTKSGYIKFDHWIFSVLYYKEWQSTYYFGSNYYEFLDSICYAGDTLYNYKLKSIQKQI